MVLEDDMSYKIIADSCCEFPEEYRKDPRFQSIPLELMVEEEVIIDDETFDQADFLRKVAASPKCPKSACLLLRSTWKHTGQKRKMFLYLRCPPN